MRTPRGLAAAIIAAAVAAAAAIATCQPAAAGEVEPATVRLGAHRFGQLRPADAIVARAGRADVGFVRGSEGASFGPWSFDVAHDGAVWLLDEVNDRLLVWRAGAPDRPARTVPLDFPAVDVALGPDGTAYVTSGGQGPDALYALWPDGRLRWKAVLPTDQVVGSLVVTDGTVYYHYHDPAETWTPMTDARGRPLSATERRRRTSRSAPLPGGLRLRGGATSEHERVEWLSRTSGEPLGGWRITSETDLGAMIGAPTSIDGDLVVTFEVTSRAASAATFPHEYVVLRLGPAGQVRQRFALDGRAMWGDKQTELRIGPDGRLYQLRTSPTTGVRVARYSLDQDPPTPPTTTTGTTTPHGPNPSVTDPPVTDGPEIDGPLDPPVTGAPTTLPDNLAGDITPAAQVGPRATGPLLILGLSALASIALAALGIWQLRRRRGGPGPAR